MEPHGRRHVHVRLQVPPHGDVRHAQRHVLTALAVLLAGCTLPGADLEAASVAVTGRVELGEGLVLLGARVTAAPRDEAALGTREAPVELREEATARTRLHRDAWVLRVDLQETAAGAAAGARRAELEWNGEERPAIHLVQTTWGRAPEGATLHFDLGTRLEASSLYVLRVQPAS